jgi:hypothetical protein
MSREIITLFILAIPIACIAWTVTHEEIFREPRDYCSGRSESSSSAVARKFFYVFTCEYCFSHYVTILFLIITRYKLLYTDWKGYVVAFFSLVFVSNIYMGLFGKVKLGVTKERVEIKSIEKDVQLKDKAA